MSKEINTKKPKNNNLGRPFLPNAKREVMSFKSSSEFIKTVKKNARKRNISNGELIRTAVAEYLNKEG